MNCLVVDDDPIARAAVIYCIGRTKFLNFIGECSKAIDIIEIIQNQKIDLIFLDVEMPEMNGIDFIKTFQDIPQIILVTGKKEYALEAFDFNVTDYILKPVDYDRFLKAALKAKNINESFPLPQEDNGDFFIKKNSKLVKINIKDINWIEALADYVTIHTNTERFILLSTMKLIESKLSSKEFARVHRSFIIRLDKIKTIEENSVSIANQVIPVSRFYKDNLFSHLKLL